MIGVTKKPRFMRFVMMSRRSRNKTDAEETVIATPATNKVCSNIKRGAKRIVALTVNFPSAAKMPIATRRIGTASAKCTRCESTTTIGSASAGNITFLMRPAFDEIELVDSSTAAEKNVHGRIPEKRKSGYGPPTAGPGKNFVKTRV